METSVAQPREIVPIDFGHSVARSSLLSTDWHLALKTEVEDVMDYQAYMHRLEMHEDQMRTMMNARGVPHDNVISSDGGLGWISASARCIFCKSVDLCANWMSGKDAALRPEDFCPNLQFFEQVSESKTGEAEF